MIEQLVNYRIQSRDQELQYGRDLHKMSEFFIISDPYLLSLDGSLDSTKKLMSFRRDLNKLIYIQDLRKKSDNTVF